LIFVTLVEKQIPRAFRGLAMISATFFLEPKLRGPREFSNR